MYLKWTYSAEISTRLVSENGWCGRRFTVSICIYIICKENFRADLCVIGFRFRFVLSPQPTPAALYLVKRCTWATPEEKEKLDHVEISPKSMDFDSRNSQENRLWWRWSIYNQLWEGWNHFIQSSGLCPKKNALTNAYKVFCVWIYGYDIRLLENTSLSTYWIIQALRM